MRRTWLWLGRAIGLAAGFGWLFVLVVGMLNPSEPVTAEGVALFGLLLAGGATVLYSFVDVRRAAIAAAVMTVAIAVFSWMSAGRNQWIAVLFTAGPFAVFSLAAWLAARDHRADRGTRDTLAT